MFPFIGIQADEEPKTPISASGMYNSSLISTVYNYSDYLLESLSEFTIMAWVRFDAGGGTNRMTIYGGLYDNLGSPSTGHFSFQGDNGADRIDFSIKSSSSTTLNVFAINTNLAEDTWYHLCVTGSVLDNELKLFLDGQLIKTSTMPYSIGIPWNAITNKSYTSLTVPFYMAQFNVFERRLTEVEVLEHYVYDDDTMSSGVLGWDAMTPTQKVDLIYSSSFIQNISISGNEFNDKTGNSTSVSPQPSLTGEQIYIYTDASDLPSDTTISPVNSLTLLNGTDYVRGTKSTAIDNLTGPQTWSIRVKFDDLVGPKHIMCLNFSAPSARASRLDISPAGDIRFYGFPTVGQNSFTTYTSTASISAGQWYHIVVATDVTTTTKIFINGVEETFGGFGSFLGMNPLLDIAIGKIWTSSGEALGSSNRAQLWNRMLSDAEVAEDYNGSATEYVCNAKQVADGSSLVTGRILDSDLSADTLIDHTGNSTLSEVGSPTYTDQGMTAECTS